MGLYLESRELHFRVAVHGSARRHHAPLAGLTCLPPAVTGSRAGSPASNSRTNRQVRTATATHNARVCSPCPARGRRTDESLCDRRYGSWSRRLPGRGHAVRQGRVVLPRDERGCLTDEASAEPDNRRPVGLPRPRGDLPGDEGQFAEGREDPHLLRRQDPQVGRGAARGSAAAREPAVLTVPAAPGDASVLA